MSNLKKPCHDCNHRKDYEGGCRSHEKALQGGGRFVDQPHPCHNIPTEPCFGHDRDLRMVASGEAEYDGDILNFVYKHRDENGNEISKGEFTHLEILALRKSITAPL